jgi:hypothetical protein
VAQLDVRYVLRCERNFTKPADLDDVTFTHDGWIEGSAISEFHGDDLIAGTGLGGFFQILRGLRGNLD